MYKNKRINKQKVRYYVKNNNSKWTVIFVHGFNSSLSFAENLFTLENNYNIIAFDLLDESSTKDLEYEQIMKITNKFIRRTRASRIILLGHSLAGGIVSKAALSSKVKKVIYMDTITPSMVDSKGYKFLKNHHQPKNKVALFLSNAIEGKVKDKYIWAYEFLNRESRWSKILNETVLDDAFMERLDKLYKSNIDKSYFVVSKDDSIISTKAFLKYAESLDKDVAIIGTRHNPIKTAPNKMNQYINALCPGKKRIFKRKVIW